MGRHNAMSRTRPAAIGLNREAPPGPRSWVSLPGVEMDQIVVIWPAFAVMSLRLRVSAGGSAKFTHTEQLFLAYLIFHSITAHG